MTRKRVIEILAPLILFLSLSQCSMSEDYTEPEYVRQAYYIINKTGKKLERRHNMTVVGTGGRMMNCVELMRLAFNINKPLSKEESRKIILDCTSEFLREINSDQEIRPYLVQFPFRVENINISIFTHDEQGRNLYDPDITVVLIDNGEITYLTDDRENKYRFKSEYVESYEDALKLTQK